MNRVERGNEAANYGGPQVHTEFKTLTPNSKRSHRIRKAHTEFEKLTPNSKSSHRIRKAHTEFEKPTPNSKSPHRIRKVHTEFEKPTPNSKSSHRIQIVGEGWYARWCVASIPQEAKFCLVPSPFSLRHIRTYLAYTIRKISPDVTQAKSIPLVIQNGE